MTATIMGKISAGLVAASVIPYAIRVHQNKIHPNLTSWFLWTLIALALLVTYKSSGAGENIWPAITGLANTALETILILRQKREREAMSNLEILCLILSLTSLGLWIAVHDQPALAQYALYLAIFAGLCAAIPTLQFVHAHPAQDRPFSWTLFAIGYALGMFAITDHTFANYVLPAYMSITAALVAHPLIAYRRRHCIPLLEWI